MQNLIAVVINDGSTDQTEFVVQKARMKYANLHYLMENNQGVSVARNNGIDFMLNKGVRFLAFLDADDIWAPGFFTDELKDLLCREEKDVYQFSHYWGNNDLTRLREHPAGNYDESSLKLNRFDRHFSSFLYNIRLFQKYGIRFPEGIKIGEDVVFRYLVFTIAKTHRSLDKYIFVYRSNSDSTLHQKSSKNDMNRFLYSIIPSWIWVKQEFIRLRSIDLSLIDDAELRQCEVMQKACAVDAIIDLCELGYSISEIKRIMVQFSLNRMIDNELYLDDKRKKLMRLIRAHPVLMRIVFRVKALGFRFIRLFRNSPLVQHIRYPLQAESVFPNTLCRVGLNVLR